MVSTHSKNISQNGSFPQIGMKIKNIRNHHLELPFPNSSTFGDVNITTAAAVVFRLLKVGRLHDGIQEV